MNLKPEIISLIEKELGIFGLFECAVSVLAFIAKQPYTDEFYISTTELLSRDISCNQEQLKLVINYLSTSKNPIMKQSYCFIDGDRGFCELDDESLITLQETKKLYHPHSGKIVEGQDSRVFLLYKTSVGKVAAL